MGVAPNKLVAKIASDLEKPDGLTVVTTDNLHAVLDPLSVRRLPGLGRKLGERVEAAGIATLGELRAAPDAVLWPIFGRDSQRMRERAAGIDERPVMSEWDEKSISAEETFFTDLADHARMQAEVLRLADRASRACARRISPPVACGEDPARRLHHLHAAEALRTLDHRLAHHRQDRRGTARRRGSTSSRARGCGC